MPSRQNATRIDPAVWESHRTEIHHYYLLEDKSLSDLTSYMKEKNNFHATKAQYERQLTLWKFRKNLTSDEWVFAIDRMEKRKREGKENDLFVDGFRIPPKRIKKEISRHRRPNETAASEQVRTPEGISIRTPQAYAAFNISLENLPWTKFQNYIESIGSIGHATNSGNTSGLDPPSLAQPSVSIQETEMLFIPGASAPITVQPGLPGTMAEQNLVGNIPSIFQMPPAFLDSQGGLALHGFASQHSQLQVVLSNLYLASNDLLSDELGEKFLQLVREHKQESALSSLFKEKMPTIEAFARFTFKHALYFQDTNLLRICLQAGADPNLPLKTTTGDLYTPLEISMYVCGNIELTKVLLDAGAHSNGLFNFTRTRFSWTSLGALTARFNIELVQLLLDLSEDINAIGVWGRAVLTAAAVGNIEPIRTLFRLGVSVQSIRELGEIAFVAATADRNIKLVRMLLKSGVNVNALQGIRGEWERTALAVATANGHIDLVQILLHAGADVNALHGQGGTALHIAAGEGNIELVQFLLFAGANVNAASACEEGGTALQTAAEEGNIELVRLLLDAGANVNAPPRCRGGSTALQAAAAGGDIELVQTLLDAGADVNAPPASGNGRTALQAAAERGRIELVRILLDAGGDVNAPPAHYGYTALQAAANTGMIDVARILLYSGADVNAPAAYQYGRTALQAAAAVGDIGLVQILLDAGADVNAPPASGNEMTALQLAADARSIEVAQILLAAGANVDASPPSGKGGTALQTAVERGDIELVRILLDAGADVNSPPSLVSGTALQAAVLAERNGTELVRILLDAGANVNAFSGGDEKRTALQAAVSGGKIELVRTLLDAGADVNASSNMTAIQEAVAGNRTELVQLLLDAGADINAPAAAFYGRTALQAAAVGGGTEMVQFLLSENADVNAPPAHAGGVTALQGAAIKGHLAIAILLLRAGADVTAAPANFMGRSALEGAAENGRLDMVQLLLDASADAENPGSKNFSKAAILAERNGHHVVAKLLRDYSN